MADLENVIASALADHNDSAASETSETVESVEDTSSDTAEVSDIVDGADDVAAEETTDGAESAEEVAEEATETAETPKVEEPVADPADKELGPAKDKKGRENRIPYSRVEKIVANKVAAATKPLQARVTEVETELTGARQTLEQVSHVERVMFEEPAQFVEILKTIPGYAEYFAAPKQSAPAVDPASEMPGPDLPDGYSPEGLKSLLTWQAAQVRQQVLDEMKPVREAVENEQRVRAQVPKMQAQLQEAMGWEGFAEHQADILAVLKTDRESQAKLGRKPRLSLEAAYSQVYTAKLKEQVAAAKAEAASAREKAIADLKKQPTSTSTAPTGQKAKPVAGPPKSLEDVIKSSIRGAKRA